MRDIRVSSEKGVVTLSGTVHTELEKAAAERFAAREDDVKNVVNMLAVASQTGPEAVESSPAAQAPPPAAPADEKPQRERRRKSARTEEASLRQDTDANAPTPSNVPPEAPASPSPAPAAQTAVAAPATPPPPAPAPPAPKPPETVTIPAGAVVTIRMIDPIDSSRNQAGEQFAASLDAPLVVGDRVVVQRGADARVRLVNAQSAGSMTGRSELRLELVSLTVNGKAYTTQSGYYEQHGASRGTRTAETVGVGAVLGALLGGLLGHGKGAAIGSAVGAGTGTAVEASTKGEQVKVPAETKLDFTLKEPVDVAMGQ